MNDGDAAAAAASGGLLGDIILDAVARHGDAIAFIDRDGETSYRAFGRMVARALHRLDELGLDRGATVAQISENCTRQYALMAAAYIGGYRSLTLHAMGGREDQLYILEDSGAQVLVGGPGKIADAAMLARDAAIACVAHEDDDAVDPFWTAGDAPAALPARAVGEAEDIVRLAYTGGTTGRPKGVMLSNRALVTNTLMALARIDFPSEIRFLCPAPISHGAGSIVLPTLVRGGTVILQRGFSAAGFAEAARDHRATVSWMVPTMIGALLDDPDLPTGALGTLETLIYSGAPMEPARVLEALDRFGEIFVQCYGQSEAPNTILILDKGEHRAAPDAAGRPFPGIEVRLLDEKDGVGEIAVRGPLVMSGYLGMAEESAKTLEGGWLRTGDLGRVGEDGLYRIVGRAKDMIISGGFNVFPAEVEAVIARDAAVAAVAVFGLPDPKWGERVTALVVPRAGHDIDAERLRDAVRAAKGAVHVPKAIHITDDLPKTGLGKPDKVAMRRIYSEGGSEGAPSAE